MAKDRETDEPKMTPLQRYLAKQAGTANAPNSPSAAGGRDDEQSDSRFGFLKRAMSFGGASGASPKPSTDTQPIAARSGLSRTGAPATAAGLGRRQLDRFGEGEPSEFQAKLEASAIEAGAPLAPPSSPRQATVSRANGETEARAPDSRAAARSSLVSERLSGERAQEAPALPRREPAEIWARTFAFFIDSVIVWTLKSVASSLIVQAFFFLPSFALYALSNFAWPIVVFFYYGWFYAERGATPGKMLFHLQVIELGTGRKLSYPRAFFRETVGKFLSGAILWVGFLIAAFREDRMALHDLLFDTRVVHQVGPGAGEKS